MTFKKHKYTSKREYLGLKMGGGYMNLTQSALELIRKETDRVDLLFDTENNKIALKPTDDIRAYTVHQTIHCRGVYHMPWARYYYIGKDKQNGYVFSIIPPEDWQTEWVE